MLNNREWATLIWFVALAIFLLSKHQLRSSLGGVVRVFASPDLWLTILALFAYVGVLVWVGRKVGLWTTALTKDTVIWLIAIALPLWLRISESARSGYFRRAATNSVKLAALLGFVLNIFVFNLWIELFLVPVLFFALCIPLVTRRDQDASAVRVANSVSSMIGFGIAAYVTWKLPTNWREVVNSETFRSLALPIWMTIGMLPFLYVVSLWANYEHAFALIDIAVDDRRERRRSKLVLVLTLGPRTSAAGSFRWPWVRELADSSTWREARERAKHYRGHWRDPDTDIS